MRDFVFDLQRLDNIYNYTDGTLVSGTSGNDSIFNGYYDYDHWKSGGSQVSINAGAGNDYINNGNGGDYSSIDGGAGNDVIDNWAYMVTVSGGTGNDTIYGDFVTFYSYKAGDGNDLIRDFNANSTLQIGGGTGTYSSQVIGSDVIVKVGTGKITLVGAASISAYIECVESDDSFDSKLITLTEGNDTYSNTVEGTTIQALGGKDSIDNYASNVSIDAGTDNDYIHNDGSKVTIVAGSGNDEIENWGENVIINALGGNDIINNYSGFVSINGGSGNDSINGGAGKDTIRGGGGNDSLLGGAGNDYLYGDEGNDTLWGDDGADVFVYNDGDGKDIIYGFDNKDMLELTGDFTASYDKTKEEIYFDVGSTEKAITLKDFLATTFNINDITYRITNFRKVDNSSEENSWTLDGSTATYGTTSNTLIKVTNVKSLDGISLSGNVVTVAKAAVNAKKITLTGSGYKLALADDVTAPTTKKAAWSYSSGTATYKSSYKTAGYTLASNAKSISYSKATTASTLATVEGVKSKKGLSIADKVITVAKAAVNAKKITLTGDGYKLALADDVTKRTTKPAAWSYSGGTATYKSSYKTAGYLLASNAKSISYYSTATTASTLASVKGAVSDTGLSSVSGKKFTLKASALSSKVTISGNGYEFDFASDYKNATITGSAKADSISARGSKVSINAGKGDDTITMRGTTSVTGGAGADVFVYKSGKHVIRDYKEEDTISIASGTAATSTSGEDLILTVGTGKITVTGGTGSTVTYFDDGGKHTYPTQSTQPYIINGKKITLTENYSEDDFDLTNYDNKYQTVDASAVQYGLKITGNKLKNLIIGTEDDDTINGGAGVDIITGGAGNDSLFGGKGNDTLTGGDGADVFVWNKGDGNDLITDYTDEDTILINGDTVKTKKASGDNLIFTLAGKNKITIQGGAYKIIDYIDDAGEHIYSHFVTYNDAGTSAKLKAGYSKKSFEPSDYAKYVDDLKTINASAVSHAMSIVGSDIANSITGTADEDYINGGAGKDTIRGGDGNDSLLGGAGNDYLYGGEGNDTLWGGAGNDYLYGGEGEDFFIYKPGEGKDRIYDYNPAVDTIKLLSGTVDNVESAGSDIVFTIGTGKIILDNAAGNYAKIVDSNGNTLKEYFPKTKG